MIPVSCARLEVKGQPHLFYVNKPNGQLYMVYIISFVVKFYSKQDYSFGVFEPAFPETIFCHRSVVFSGYYGFLGVRSLFRQPIIPTAHCSDGPLFRQPNIPTAHCSDSPFLRQPIIPSKMVKSSIIILKPVVFLLYLTED